MDMKHSEVLRGLKIARAYNTAYFTSFHVFFLLPKYI